MSEISLQEDAQEYILCAAIYLQDGKTHVHQPRNIESGLVIAGRRHHNCFATIAGLINREEYGKNGNIEQGFITSKDRYVTRQEAWVIAKEANQLHNSVATYKEGVLLSEDLY